MKRSILFLFSLLLSAALSARMLGPATTDSCGKVRSPASGSTLFTIRQDTVIFNPSVLPYEKDEPLNALLDQIPGIHLHQGALYWNGKEVEILVNGESRFDGNGLLCLLPCEYVKEIWIYNCASDLTQLTGRDDQEEDYKFDIRTRNEIPHPRYGRGNLAYQTPNLYNAEAEGIFLGPKHPLIFFTNFNNLNLSTTPEHLLNTSHDIDQFGRQQYGALAYQYNWETLREGKTLHHLALVNAQLTNEDGWGDTDRYIHNELTEGLLNVTFEKKHHHSDRLHPQFVSKVSWSPDTAGTLTWNTQFDFDKEQTTVHTEDKIFDYFQLGYENEEDENRKENVWNENSEHHRSDLGYFSKTFPTPDGTSPTPPHFASGGDTDSSDSLKTTSWERRTSGCRKYKIHTDLKWTRFFIHRNQLEIKAVFVHQQRNLEEQSLYRIDYVIPDTALHLGQYNEHPLQETKFRTHVFYKQWLSRRWLFVGNYYLRLGHHREKRNLFQTDLETMNQEELQHYPDSNNTYRYGLNQQEHEVSAHWACNFRHLSILTGIRWLHRHERLHFLQGSTDTLARRNFHALEPELLLRGKITPTIRWQLAYEYQPLPPELLQTLSWREQIHPLYFRSGNRDLRNSHSHTLEYRIHCSLPHPQITLLSVLKYQHIRHPFTNALSYTSSATRFETRWVNATHPANNFEGYFYYHQSWAPAWRFKNQLHIFLEKSEALSNISLTAEDYKGRQRQLQQFELQPALTYDRPALLSCTFYGNLTLTIHRYESAQKRTERFRKYDFGVILKKDIAQFHLFSQLHDVVYKGHALHDHRRHHLIWSAGAAWYLLQGRGKLQLSADDLLNQTQETETLIAPHHYEEIFSRRLHHFLRLSFTCHLHH